MVGLIFQFLNLVSSIFKSKSRLEAENAALRQQLTMLQRKVRGRVQFTNSDRVFFHPAVSLVSGNPQGHDDHPAGDAGALASCGLSSVLGLEISEPGRPVRAENLNPDVLVMQPANQGV